MTGAMPGLPGPASGSERVHVSMVFDVNACNFAAHSRYTRQSAFFFF